MIYMITNELQHHGIKGMKWGVRRFQNYDGTRIKTGSKYTTIYGNDKSDLSNKADKFFKPSVKIGKDKSPVSPAEKVTKDAVNIANHTSNISKITRKARLAKETDPKDLTDEELTTRIKRLELERRYSDLSANDIERGHITVEEYASIAASIATVIGSAASIYAIFKNL